MAISSLASSGSNVNVIFGRLFFAPLLALLLFDVDCATISLLFAFSSLYSFLIYKTNPTFTFLSITTRPNTTYILHYLRVRPISGFPPTVVSGRGAEWSVTELVAGRRTGGCGCGVFALFLNNRIFGFLSIIRIKKRVQGSVFERSSVWLWMERVWVDEPRELNGSARCGEENRLRKGMMVLLEIRESCHF